MATDPAKPKKTPRTPKPPPTTKPDERFHVLRDTREKAGHGFRFISSTSCSGSSPATLKTGDYTIRGLEDVVCLERKGSIVEFATNITGKADAPRFERELARMAAYPVAIVLLEFDMETLLGYPRTSDIPFAKRKRIKVTGAYLLKRLFHLMSQYPHVHFVFAGGSGQAVALAILKQAWADYKHLTNETEQL